MRDAVAGRSGVPAVGRAQVLHFVRQHSPDLPRRSGRAEGADRAVTSAAGLDPDR